MPKQTTMSMLSQDTARKIIANLAPESVEDRLSPWFNGREHKPARPGVYMQMSGASVGYQKWDGIKWGPWCSEADRAERTREGDYASDTYQSDNWRGLLRPN